MKILKLLFKRVRVVKVLQHMVSLGEEEAKGNPNGNLYPEDYAGMWEDLVEWLEDMLK